jgi:hypothetical protein
VDVVTPDCVSEKSKLLKFGHLSLVLVALSLWSPASLIAQTKHHKSNLVPFVGCESDGDDGIQPAPEGESKVVALDRKDAKRFAYYDSERSAGILAPRGWHGFGTYGLWGSRIIVTPNPLKIDASDASDVDAAVCIKESRYDGLRLFGRWGVANVIARVFPTQREYLESVSTDSHPASSYPVGPYPKDKLTYRSDLVVEFQTPPHCEGLGELTPNDQPIYGVAVLHPEGEGPTAVLLTVRLTPHNVYLASKIIQQFESDELAPEPTPDPPSAASVAASPPVANDKEDTRTPEQKQSDLDLFDRAMPGDH